MSKDEQDLIGAKLLWEYQADKRSLYCLKAMARELSEKLKEWSETLCDLDNCHVPSEYPSQAEIERVVDRVNRTITEIARKRKSLAGMGVQFPIE